MASSNLLARFEADAIDPAQFDHRCPVEVAYEMLSAYPFLRAVQSYSQSIQALAMRAGAPEKFNLTVTLAFLSLIAERRSRHRYSSFEAFAAENPDLLSSHVLEQWYTSDRLASELARHQFLMPDGGAKEAGA